ncbi:hypothetical protein QFC21_006712 [Naganishia friedmannii]|uniref:Uncharacterized protein n=1 Tax=Naganishia friedmannii TaxID=89922 RepID=A0ACC2UZX9_9TREE|nr:hypothetical protein QFC21_006712 [Naganishia friedmannii]
MPNNHYSPIQQQGNTPHTYQDPYQSIPLAQLPPTMFNKNKDPVVIEQSTTAMDEEEEEMLRKGMMDWNAMKKKAFWFNRDMISAFALALHLAVIVALMAFFHTNIIHWLTPAANKFRALKGGWVIPIAIIFVLIVLILVGVVWGLGEGFGIAAAGTILLINKQTRRSNVGAAYAVVLRGYYVMAACSSAGYRD